MKKESVLQIVNDQLEHKGIDYCHYWNSEDGELITADWNDLEQDKFDQLEHILEKFDVRLDWIDEWDSCAECGLGVRISPTSYHWQPEYIKDEYGHRICRECFEKHPETFIEFYKENADAAFYSWAVPTLEKLGYEEQDREYETGFHYGQNDDPNSVRKDLIEAGIYDFVFVVKSTGQFDVNWSVFIREGE